jgi:ribosomal protein S18 acetylase RimI-like enzyme
VDKEPIVRKATSADIPVLIGLMKEFYAESHYDLDAKWAANAFNTFLSDEGNGCVWIACIGEEAAGHVVLTVRFTMEYGGLSGYVDDLFVKRQFRKRGAASSLLQIVERECTARKCRSLIVEVGKDNDAALATYKKLGMKKVDDGRILYRKALT